jgi:hypothetical protein
MHSYLCSKLLLFNFKKLIIIFFYYYGKKRGKEPRGTKGKEKEEAGSNAKLLH